jgi:hypothetical protein
LSFIDIVLYGDRHAMQRAQRLPRSQRRVGGIGRSQCALAKRRDDRIDTGIDRGQAIETGGNRLPARNNAKADRACQIDRIPLPQLSRQIAQDYSRH